MATLLIDNAAEVVTLAGPARARVGEELAEPAIVAGASVFVRDGLIEAIGTGSQISDRADAETVRIDAGGMTVAPGFVDAHTHPVFAGWRAAEYELRVMGATYEEIAAAGGGIRNSVRRTRAASDDDLAAIGLRNARVFLEHGTTTIEAKSGYGLSVDDECRLLSVIRRMGVETPLEVSPTLLGAHEIPDEYRDRPDAYVDLVVDEMIPRVAREGLAEGCDVFCESHVFSIDQARRVLVAARAHGLTPRFHADQLTRCGGAELAAEVGAASADHLEQLDDPGIDALVRGDVSAVLLPGSVYHLGLKRYAPARRLIDAGAKVVLATDFNPGSSPVPSMQMVLSLACTQMRMRPCEAFAAATINAAYALGRGDRVGSIEPGKQADLVLFDAPDHRNVPYVFGVNHAVVVVKRGVIVADRRP
ncbi:MAG: imidazolonepropionase [Blastocatellia bacterium]|nr:imidazolonepropionase [Blastocatellia bacterium]